MKSAAARHGGGRPRWRETVPGSSSASAGSLIDTPTGIGRTIDRDTTIPSNGMSREGESDGPRVENARTPLDAFGAFASRFVMDDLSGIVIGSSEAVGEPLDLVGKRVNRGGA